MVDHLEKEYTQLLNDLPQQLTEHAKRMASDYASLVYVSQMGDSAGEEMLFTYGTRTGARTHEIFIGHGFDRSIGKLTFEHPRNPDALSDAERLCESIALRSYQLKNEICAAKIANLIKADLSENSISTRGYNDLAQLFSQILGTSGFVLWHICSKSKTPSGEYEMQILEGPQQLDDSALFLHALGSFPPVAVDMPLSDGIASYVMKSGRSLRLDDILDGSELEKKASGAKVRHPAVVAKNGWRSGVFLPLSTQGRLAGVVGAYSKRVQGFNNLDELLVSRCAEQVAAYSLVHRSRQRYSKLLSKIEAIGIEVAAAQYSVYGSVHDAINAAAGARDNFDFISPTRETQTYFVAAKDHINRLSEVLGKLRTDIRNPKNIPVQRAKIDLKSFLSERLQALTIDAKRSGIDVQIKVAKEFFIDADRFRLSQVFSNIVSNSIRNFGNTARLPKVISIDAFSSDTREIKVIISDNGPGINPELLPERIFEPFVSTTEGMGLGLTIVRSFIEEMGGQISITSRWGEGTSVHISLPPRRHEV